MIKDESLNEDVNNEGFKAGDVVVSTNRWSKLYGKKGTVEGIANVAAYGLSKQEPQGRNAFYTVDFGKYGKFTIPGWEMEKINNESLDESDEEFEDYNPDDVPEDDTEDYKDHILRSHEEFDLDDTETESLKPVLNEDVKDWNSQAEKDRFAKHCHMFGLEPEDQFEVFISEQGNEEQILGIIKPYSNEPSLIIKNLQTNVEWAWNQRIFHKLFYKWKKDRYAQYGSKEADYDEEEREANEPQFEPINPPVNLYDYLKENSNGAWISFSFQLDDGDDWATNYCHGLSDFRGNPELLKRFEVIGELCSGFSQSQGSHYELKVRKIKDVKEGIALGDWGLSDEERKQWREFEHYTNVIDYALYKTLTSEFEVKVAGGIWERPNKEEEKYISGFEIVKHFSPSREYQEIPPEVLKRALEICKENNVQGEAVKGISVFPHVNFVIHYDFGQWKKEHSTNEALEEENIANEPFNQPLGDEEYEEDIFFEQ